MERRRIRTGIIYLVTNLANGKRYVGQTVQRLSMRKWVHLREAASGSPFAFHRAIRRYGDASFKWEEMATVPARELDSYEVAYIAMIGSRVPNGYNMTDGGDGGASVWANKTRAEREAWVRRIKRAVGTTAHRSRCSQRMVKHWQALSPADMIAYRDRCRIALESYWDGLDPKARAVRVQNHGPSHRTAVYLQKAAEIMQSRWDNTAWAAEQRRLLKLAHNTTRAKANHSNGNSGRWANMTEARRNVTRQKIRCTLLRRVAVGMNVGSHASRSVGIANPASKVNPIMVLAIRRLYDAGYSPQRIRKKLHCNIGICMIRWIGIRKNWKSVPEESCLVR